jgi:hypothetical protein
MFPEPFAQTMRLRFSPNGDEKDFSAHQVMTRRDEFRVAIVTEPHDEPFDLILAMPTGGARRLNNPERIREAVADANNQLKNALQYKVAPCLLMVVHDGLDVPDEVIIKSALYGNLKYNIPPGDVAASGTKLCEDGVSRRRSVFPEDDAPLESVPRLKGEQGAPTAWAGLS